MTEKTTDISKEDEPKKNSSGSTGEELWEVFNAHISQLCRLVALIIAGVAFATVILGQDDPTFVLLGLCLSVILLAIAGMHNHVNPKR